MSNSKKVNGNGSTFSKDHILYQMARQETEPVHLPPPAYGPAYNATPDKEAFGRRVGRDFRSDTLTTPTLEMFKAMEVSSIGDDFYEEDTCSNEFQAGEWSNIEEDWGEKTREREADV